MDIRPEHFKDLTQGQALIWLISSHLRTPLVPCHTQYHRQLMFSLKPTETWPSALGPLQPESLHHPFNTNKWQNSYIHTLTHTCWFTADSDSILIHLCPLWSILFPDVCYFISNHIIGYDHIALFSALRTERIACVTWCLADLCPQMGHKTPGLMQMSGFEGNVSSIPQHRISLKTMW